MANDPNVWAHRKEPHTTPETRYTRCDNCPHLFAIEQERSRIHRWAYYCDAMHSRFTYRELYAISQEECPEHKPIRRRSR